MWKRAIFAGLMSIALGESAGGIAKAQYAVGFVWNRAADWTPGTTVGSTVGNPDDDALGNPVWRYDLVEGGPLGSATPWYAAYGQKLRWYVTWFSQSGPNFERWYRGQNQDPSVNSTYIEHSSVPSWAYTSMVAWMNPTAMPVRVRVSGTLGLGWGSCCGGTSGVVQIAIARRPVAPGPVALLYSAEFDGSSGSPSITVALPTLDVCVGPADEIVITFRKLVSSGAFVLLSDPFVQIELLGTSPDCDGNGALSVADFGCFQGKYVLGDLYADCNASGDLTVADFGCFQGKYVLGCP